tara:strand:- start:885 stop:1343 length:459 start_codon:yes stop_codon:yes gene_type:complete
MYIILKTIDDDYQSDIIFCEKTAYEPSLSKEELDNIDYLFCIDNLQNSRVFASNKREIRLTYKYRQMFNLNSGYTLEDIFNCLKDIELAFIRRRVVDGIKIDNDFVIDKGIFKDIQGGTAGWDYTNIILDVNGNETKVSPHRVFYFNQSFDS